MLLALLLTTLDVRVDPRVELVSIVFRLAGNPELNMPAAASPYSADVDTHFAAFREHRAVQLAKELRRDRGISYDAIMSLALHLEDAQALKPKIPLSPRPALLEARWQIADVERFLPALRAFAVDSHFAAFAAANAERYRRAADAVALVVNQRDYVGWFDRLFGARKAARFAVIIGLLCGNGNYGMAVRDHRGREEITPIIGVSEWDKAGLPRTTAAVSRLVVHELAHCYTNEYVDKHEAALLPAGAKLFAANRALMEQQAYGNAKTLLYESLVRAVVAYYVLSVDGAEAGKLQLVSEMVRGFKWTKELRDAITGGNRFDSLMPKVIAVLDAAANDYEALVAKFPRVLTVDPPNGAGTVDPATRAIVITFSAKMAPAWSILGGGPSFPQAAGSPHWDATKTVLTIPVHLEPGRRYELGLNGFQHHSFVSVDGYPLERTVLEFTTR